jgi:hypothetical protein
MRPPSRSETLTAAPSELPLEPMLGMSVRIHPFRFDSALPVDVRLVRWPMESSYRDELRAAAMPRLLIVDAGASPPPLWDELEDWVRVPVDRAELELRAATVARRADLLDRPWLDDDGMLWFRDRWCSISRGQAALVQLLVEHFGTVVRDEDVDAVFTGGDTSAHLEAIKTTVRRVSQSLAPLGLQLKRVRASGYLLDRCP